MFIVGRFEAKAGHAPVVVHFLPLEHLLHAFACSFLQKLSVRDSKGRQIGVPDPTPVRQFGHPGYLLSHLLKKFFGGETEDPEIGWDVFFFWPKPPHMGVECYL